MRSARRPNIFKGLLAFLSAWLIFFGATSPARAEQRYPQICEMLDAFDQALQQRYYEANFAPAKLGCSFVDEAGCAFDAPRQITIRVTHARDLGCDESGDCRFQARQTCEAEMRALFACRTLMYQFTAYYEVSGSYIETGHAGGGWRLDDWRRDPAPALEAARFQIETLCPST